MRRKGMKTLNKQDDTESTFGELLGEELVFFNKDDSLDTPFRKRSLALEHDEESDCLECENE